MGGTVQPSAEFLSAFVKSNPDANTGKQFCAELEVIDAQRFEKIEPGLFSCALQGCGTCQLLFRPQLDIMYKLISEQSVHDFYLTFPQPDFPPYPRSRDFLRTAWAG